MSLEKLCFGFALALECFILTLGQATSQKGLSNQTPDQKPRQIRNEPNRIFKDWPNKEVSLIITPDERRAYEKLTTDEEREQFIQIFWRHRDTDPDTEENEYKDEYYQRLAYANEHFSSGKPGWLTDRGRIYIKFGKPDEIESHPSGGLYQRLPYEGSGSITTYAFERWFYRYIPNVGSGVEIEFVDPSGSGEYRIARNPDEKVALQSQRADPTGFGSNNYRREQDSPFAIAKLLVDLEAPPEVHGNYFGGRLTGTPKFDANALYFEIQPSFFRQSDNRVLTAFTIQLENKDLVFKDSGGLQVARLNIFGRVTSVAARRIGDFEDIVTTTATSTELTESRERKSAYAKAFILEPGRYRVEVMVRDIFSGATGIRQIGFQVPKYEEDQLATSTIVLAAKLESLNGEIAASPFVIGQTKVIPNLTGVYRQGQPIGVYLQLYNAGVDQTTLRPAVDVAYVLLKEGRELSQQAEDWREMNGYGQRLTITRLIDSRSLAPGEYELAIRIRDRVTGQTLSPSAKFSVVQ